MTWGGHMRLAYVARALVPGVVALAGCSRPSAMSVCKKLEAGDVATACRADAPEGLAVAATEFVRFDLKDTPGKHGLVMRFESEEHLLRTARSYEALEAFAGKNRFLSPKARVLIILSPTTAENDVEFTRDLVNEL